MGRTYQNLSIEVHEELPLFDVKIFNRITIKDVKLPKLKVYCNSMKCRKTSAIPKNFIWWEPSWNIKKETVIDKGDLFLQCYCPGCKKNFAISALAYEAQTKEKIK